MTFARGLLFPEGPVALSDGSLLVVEGGESRGCITRISADGSSRSVIAVTGRPNGLAVDDSGAIWTAESKTPSLLRVTLDGKTEVIARDCDGEPFLFPNDLCIGPDGQIYMTDSGVFIDDFAPGGNIRPDYLSVPMDGRVYQIDPKARTTRKVDSGIRFTNGIAFGPDDRLYVNETVTGNVYRYDLGEAGVGPRQCFGNVRDPKGPPGWRGPDGMAFGTDGRLYVAVFGQRGVTVLDASGEVAERIKTAGKLPTNVCFGLPGSRRIYVTEYEFGTVETFEVPSDGYPLWTKL